MPPREKTDSELILENEEKKRARARISQIEAAERVKKHDKKIKKLRKPSSRNAKKTKSEEK